MKKLKLYLTWMFGVYAIIFIIYLLYFFFAYPAKAPTPGQVIAIETNWISNLANKIPIVVAPLLIPLFGLFFDKTIVYAPGTEYRKLKKEIVTKIRSHLETIFKTESAHKDDIDKAVEDIKELASHLLDSKTDLENRHFIRILFSIPSNKALDKAFNSLDQLDTLCGGKDSDGELEQRTKIHYARCIIMIEKCLKIKIDPKIKDKWRQHMLMKRLAKDRRLRHAEEVRQAGIKSEVIKRVIQAERDVPFFDFKAFKFCGKKTEEEIEIIRQQLLNLPNFEAIEQATKAAQELKQKVENVVSPISKGLIEINGKFEPIPGGVKDDIELKQLIKMRQLEIVQKKKDLVNKTRTPEQIAKDPKEIERADEFDKMTRQIFFPNEKPIIHANPESVVIRRTQEDLEKEGDIGRNIIEDAKNFQLSKNQKIAQDEAISMMFKITREQQVIIDETDALLPEHRIPDNAIAAIKAKLRDVKISAQEIMDKAGIPYFKIQETMSEYEHLFTKFKL